MLFSKKIPEDAQCRYCKHVTENEKNYVCRYMGQVSPAGSCRRYRFDPLAKRDYRKRNLDTTGFDPLDFEV